nr:EOG090X0CGF [Leptodora kindtii]
MNRQHPFLNRSFNAFVNNILPDILSRFKNVNEGNFDATFMRICLVLANYKVGKDYFDCLQSKGKEINVATLSRFLTLSYISKANVSDKKHVQDLCDKLAALKVHDILIDEGLIHGLCLIGKWREGMGLLPDMEFTGSPGGPVLNVLAECALDDGDFSTALSLMNKMLLSKKKIGDKLYLDWLLKYCTDPKVLNLLMSFWSQNEIFPTRAVIEKLKSLSEESGGFTGSFTTVCDTSGKCRHCNQTLQQLELNNSQFEDLKKAVMEQVLIGKDIFAGSNPDEVAKFRNFVHRNSPFDIIIDGLNVVYCFAPAESPSGKMDKLKNLVQYFAKQNKKVLILGRHHMLKWSKKSCDEINRIASFFTTDDISKDDPFLLYAALYSGAKAKFVSEDLMRDHMSRMGKPDLEATFRRWQRSCQIQIVRIDAQRKVHVLNPVSHLTAAQRSQTSCWHIPYDDGEPRFTYQLPKTWLCLQPAPQPEKHE